MIPLTLLCLALFALAWGCYSHAQFWHARADRWMARAIAAECDDGPRLDFPRPMSTQRIVTRSDARWSSLDELMAGRGRGE